MTDRPSTRIDGEPMVVLTIAGSDPSGGAGIQADLRTFAALRTHGTSAVAALTAQDGRSLRGRRDTPSDFLGAQIDAVTDSLALAGTKTGMLGSADNVACVAERARGGALGLLVVDPVLMSSAGHDLGQAARDAYMSELVPQALVLTPNLDEAQALTGVEINGIHTASEAARALVVAGADWVVIKGGQRIGPTVAKDECVDLVYNSTLRCGGPAQPVKVLSAPRVVTANDRGTGCTFSAALVCYLAGGLTVLEALAQAKRFVTAALAGASSWSLGPAPGPMDQLGWNGSVAR
ncbi:MAG: bifunctional hydroxymethylpyrimidine kinase/phosphomethylpyrimidine kinase [Acidimicrobiales bacterium]